MKTYKTINKISRNIFSNSILIFLSVSLLLTAFIVVRVLNLKAADAIFTKIAAGNGFSVALDDDGNVWAWGNNSWGQLGNGTYDYSSEPVQVSGLTDVIAIASAMGGTHALAVKSDGTVWAWGWNGNGQLGDGTTDSSNVPVQVSGLTDVISVAGGQYYSMALKSDGTVWTWGSGGSGVLGNGTWDESLVPVQVDDTDLDDAIAIGSERLSVLAVNSDGTVWAWGYNGDGCLGDGTTNPSNVPVQTTGLTNITDVSGGEAHGMALKSDGTVWAWGYSPGGLGDGMHAGSTIPVQVDDTDLDDASFISGGRDHMMAINSDGTVWAWGYNENGQLGDGTTNNRNVPTQVTGLTNMTAVSGGERHSLALKSDGTVWAWGANDYGQLGDGMSTLPAQVDDTDLTTATAIASGYSHSLALKSDGTVWAWGGNDYGQLGDGTETYSNVPVPVDDTNLTTAIDIAAEGDYSLAVKTGGTVWAWGENGTGKLGDGTTNDSNVPVQTSGLTNATAVAAGANHAMALKSDGTVWAWGYNADGCLGDGTNDDSLTPVQVDDTDLDNAIAIAAGGVSALAINDDNTLWAWGCILGNGTDDCSNVPVQVDDTNLTTATVIAIGNGHSLAIKSDGTVWAWGGDNEYGALGDGTTDPSNVPVQVTGLTNVIGIAAGEDHSMALKSDGTVWAWGINDSSQLGDGTWVNSLTPVQVDTLTDITAITAGAYHSMALKDDDTVWAWGANYAGQLGIGSYDYAMSPLQIITPAAPGGGGDGNVATTTNVPNTAPAWTTDASDGGSTGTAPTNVGANVAFSAQGTDPNADSYYLVVCKAAGITPATHACTGGTWGTSALTASAGTATVNYTALIGDVESNAWYAYLCDNNASPLCSAASQGSTNPSPFFVNHAPTFGTLRVGSVAGGTGTIIPGSTVYFHLDADGGTNGIDDNDANTAPDTVRAYICDSTSTGVSLVSNLCTGGSAITICAQSTPFNPNSVAFECNSTTIASVPTIDGSKNFNIFVYDSHDFAGTGTTAQTYTVANVAPTVGTYTAGALTLTAGNSTSYSFTVVLSDNNGYADITAANGLIYNDTTVNLSSGLCSANELNCYLQPTCTLAGGSGTTVTATCPGITAWYNANDTTSGAVWKAHVNPVDEAGTVTSGADSSTFTVNTLQALNVPETSIAYGSVATGSVSDSVTVTLQNLGNIISDVGIYGTDMTAVSTIGKAQQHWAILTGFTWGTDDHALQASATAGGTANTGCANQSLAVRTVHTSAASDKSIYWKISIPSGTPSGIYTGANTFATYANTCTGTD